MLLLAGLRLPQPTGIQRAAILLATTPPPLDPCCAGGAVLFEDFERECFGDEDGCDAWYYGEDPTEPRTTTTNDAKRMETLREEGRRAIAERRQRAAAAGSYEASKAAREKRASEQGPCL